MPGGPGRREQIGTPAVYPFIARGTLFINAYGDKRVVVPTHESVLQAPGALVIHAEGHNITDITFKRDVDGRGTPGIFRGVFLSPEQDDRLLSRAANEGKTPRELLEGLIGEGLQNGYETPEALRTQPIPIPLIISQTA